MIQPERRTNQTDMAMMLETVDALRAVSGTNAACISTANAFDKKYKQSKSKQKNNFVNMFMDQINFILHRFNEPDSSRALTVICFSKKKLFAVELNVQMYLNFNLQSN